MISLFIALPTLFLSAIGFILIKIRYVKDLNWEEAKPIALYIAIISEISIILLLILKELITTTPEMILSIFLILYIPASVYFARKYGSMLQGIYITTFNGNKPLAYPLDVSDIFLGVLALVIVFFGKSDPSEMVLIIALGLMFFGALLGIFWYEKKFFVVWSANLTITNEGEVISCLSEEQAIQDPKGSCSTLGILMALDWLGIGISYFGLPVLLILTLPKPSPTIVASAMICLAGVIFPPLYFALKKRRVAQEFKVYAEKVKN